MPEQQDPISNSRSPTRERRRIDALEERLQDLAQDQRRLHQQLREILDLLGDQAGTVVDASPPQAAATEPRGPGSLPRRALRAVLRSTLGVAKRLWQASDPARDWFVEVTVDQKPADALPSLGVFYQDAGAPPADSPSMDAMADPRDEHLWWDRSSGTLTVHRGGGESVRHQRVGTVEAVRRTATVDVLMNAGGSDLDAATVELVRLTLAAENLTFLATPGVDGEGHGNVWVRRDLWHPETDIDQRQFDRLLHGRDAVVGKSLGGYGATGLAGMLAAGHYRVSKSHLPYVHRLRPLTGLGHCSPDAATDERALLVILGAPLTGGLEQLAADLPRALGDRYRLIFASTEISDDLQRERLRQLAGAVTTYPLADWLPAEILPSAVEVLACRHRAAAVLHLGEGTSRAAIEDQLSTTDPSMPMIGPPSPACGVSAPQAAAVANRDRVPTELGIPDGAILVTMISDLVARQRPEDFVTLAHRFRQDDRFFFLLVGHGPLAGTVGDLERLLAPDNFRAVSTAPTPDVLAITDIACVLSEDGAFPYFVLNALTAGLPVVATDVDGLGELLAEGPCGVAVPVADLEACEEAIQRLAEEPARRAMGAAGSKLIDHRFRFRKVFATYQQLVDELLLRGGR